MNMHKRSALVLVAVLVASCTRASKPFILPKAEEVDSIFVSKHDAKGLTVWTYDIKDRKRIDAIVEHLQKHNPDEYRIETDLYAYWVNKPLTQYEYSFALMKPTSMALAVLVGPDWLGGAHDGVEYFNGKRLNVYRRRPLGAEERKELVRLLEMRPGDRNMLDQD
ncbi:MAG TPA: hypothetical protein VH394_06975 [Thermoanaerobaculia bacterium]|jgi:hypothetical protein|nr:hypothetical protein [Thermoanaerobaculia bacterium]